MVKRALVVVGGFIGVVAAIHLVAIAAVPDKPIVPALVGKSSVVEKSAVESALSETAVLRFDKTPLKEFAAAIGKQYHVNVLLDRKGLTDAGIGDSTPISFALEGGSLRSGLRLLLRRHGLGYFVLADNALLITTADAEKEHVVSRFYDVRDLVGYDKPSVDGGMSADYDSLIEAITSSIAPGSWDSAGGPGAIDPILGCLIIPQSEENHEQIVALLAGLRKVQRAGPAGCEPVRTDVPDTPLAAAVQSRLDKKQDIHFAGGELSAVVAWLRQLGIPTTVEDDAETQASKENQFAPLNLTQVPLDWALSRILHQHDLGFLIDGAGLVISTQKEADRRVESVVYSLGHLPGAASATSQTDLDRLAKAVADPQSPNSPSWSISIVPDAGAFICVQSHEAQARFGKLLAQLRANAKPAQPAAPETAAVIKVYRLAVNSSKGAADASEADAQKYVTAIRNLVEPKSWTKGTGNIAALPGAIVIRQLPAVQEQVRDMLVKLGASIREDKPQAKGFENSGFQGGGGAFNLIQSNTNTLGPSSRTERKQRMTKEPRAQ
jgi:hypothetical protein